MFSLFFVEQLRLTKALDDLPSRKTRFVISETNFKAEVL